MAGLRGPCAQIGALLCRGWQMWGFLPSYIPSALLSSSLWWWVWSNSGKSPCLKHLLVTRWELTNWCWISCLPSEAYIFFFRVSPCLIWFLLLSFCQGAAGEHVYSWHTHSVYICFLVSFLFKETFEIIFFPWSAKTQMDKTAFSTKTWLFKEGVWIFFTFPVTRMSIALWSKPKLWYFSKYHVGDDPTRP